MSITGLTTVAGSDGVERVTASQTVSGTGGVDGETITVATGIYVGTSGTFTIQRTTWRAHEPGTGNDTTAFLHYNSRTATNTMQILDDSMVLVERASGRSNAQLSNLKDSYIVVTGGSTEVFIYIQNGGEWERCTLKGINVIESIGVPGVFFQVKILQSTKAFLNWEAGRIDRIGIDIPSTTSYYFTWIGTGNSGNNSVYDWNPVQTTVDDWLGGTPSSGRHLLLQHANSHYEWGFTVSWLFKDLDSGNAQADASVIFSDDYDDIGGTLSEVGRWTSGSDGILEGTVDSRTRSTGSSQDRPTIFVTKQVAVETGSSGSTGQGDPTTCYYYNIEDISFTLEIRSYGHLEEAVKSTLENELGKMAGDYSVTEYRDYLLKPDAGVTGTKAAADALTEIADLNDFFDRTKAEWRDNDDYPLPEKDGNYIDLGATNLVIDASAGSAWAYSSGSNTITIYPGSDGIIDATAKYTGIKTTGTITLANNADTDAILTDTNGSRVFITLNNVIVGSRYRIEKSSDQSLVVEGEAMTSTVTEPYIWTTDINFNIIVKQSSFSQRYFPFRTSGTITQSGLTVWVAQLEDNIAEELAAFTQIHYRWRNDDNDEVNATWKQNEDVDHTGQAKTTNFRLRISIDETYGLGGSLTPTIQFRKVGSDTWEDVT